MNEVRSAFPDYSEKIPGEHEEHEAKLALQQQISGALGRLDFDDQKIDTEQKEWLDGLRTDAAEKIEERLRAYGLDTSVLTIETKEPKEVLPGNRSHKTEELAVHIVISDQKGKILFERDATLAA